MNNMPVATERTLVIFGFKTVKFWVNSYESNPKTSFQTSSRVYQQVKQVS